MIRLREADRDSLTWQNVSEQRVGGAVELRNRDDVGAQPSDVEHRIIERGLSRTDAQGFQASLERSDASFQHCRGGVTNTAVTISFGFEIE